MVDEAARARIRERLAALPPGVGGVLLVDQGGRTLVEECVGLADRAAGTPVTPDTSFGTASVTKLLTAVAVLDQVGHGALDLHAPVVDLVPPGRRPASLAPEVTVHHLLSHTSGIADYFEEDDELPGHVGDDYGVLWRDTPPSRMQRPADFLPLYGERAAYGPPGEVWRYSNAGYVLLAEVLEQVTGRPSNDVVTERVLARAGATTSGFHRSDDPVPGMALHYRPSGRTNVHDVPVVGGGDGGCVCTAADLVRCCRALADGTLLGGLTATMLTAHADAGDGFGYGYGAVLYPDGRWGHGGGDPGVDAIINHWPQHDLTVVALCNVEEDEDLSPAVALRDAFLAEGSVGGGT